MAVMRYLMGLDIGTSGCKATVFNELGEFCCSSYREYPAENYDGRIDAGLVWEKVKEVMAECAACYSEIDAVCTTSFGETVVAVDRNGKVLAPAILYTDDNAAQELSEIESLVGKKRIAEITGLIPHPMYTISRLCRMKRCQPEVYENTYKFLFMASFIELCMGAGFIAEDTLASRSMAYDIRKGEWWAEILDKTGISIDKMPKVVKAGDVIGKMPDTICRELNLKNQPLIIAGGHDQPCVALGMGAIAGGDGAYGMGTVECFTLVMDDYRQTEKMEECHLVCAPHVVPGKYLTYGVLLTGGVVLKDLRSKLYQKEMWDYNVTGRDVYDIMMEEMPDESSGLLYLPHLAGSGTPYMDTHDRGGIYGMTLKTTRGELVRAALEGIAFDIRLNLENMAACALPVRQIMAGGGGVKSDRGLQVRADILQREIHAARDIQAGTRGAFYIAAKAIGIIENYDVSASWFEKRDIEPDCKKAESMERQYHRYLKFHRIVRDLEV